MFLRGGGALDINSVRKKPKARVWPACPSATSPTAHAEPVLKKNTCCPAPGTRPWGPACSAARRACRSGSRTAAGSTSWRWAAWTPSATSPTQSRAATAPGAPGTTPRRPSARPCPPTRSGSASSSACASSRRARRAAPARAPRRLLRRARVLSWWARRAARRGASAPAAPVHGALGRARPQAWREDRTLIAAGDMIADALGQRIVESVPLSMEAAWAESRPTTPLICLLSPGAPPRARPDGAQEGACVLAGCDERPAARDCPGGRPCAAPRCDPWPGWRPHARARTQAPTRPSSSRTWPSARRSGRWA